jgi:hypothetical protein
MKTFLTAAALTLVSAVSIAKVADRAHATYSQVEAGSEFSQPLAHSAPRAVVKDELKLARRLPGYVDGSSFERASAMFTSAKSREQVRAEAAAAPRLSGHQQLAVHGGAN